MRKKKTAALLLAVCLCSAGLWGCRSADLPAWEDMMPFSEESGGEAEEPKSSLEDSQEGEPEDFDGWMEEPSEDSRGTSPEIQDPGGPIGDLREYLFPSGEIVELRVGQGDCYRQPLSVIPYQAFDAEDIISRLEVDSSQEESDENGDGEIDSISCVGERVGWKMMDSDYDGLIDYCVVITLDSSHYTDLKAEWTDHDKNGTFDEVKIHAAEPKVQYLYGDFSDVDFDTGKANYDNAGRIRFIQLMTEPEGSELGEQQFFRDLDGDGYADAIQLRRFYDTDDDGVKESMKILNDRDRDGVFEDEYAYDGTIFDDSLLYD